MNIEKEFLAEEAGVDIGEEIHKQENRQTSENFMIIEISDCTLEECQECGSKNFLSCTLTTSSNVDGKRKHVNGLKCFDCGIIYCIKE